MTRIIGRIDGHEVTAITLTGQTGLTAKVLRGLATWNPPHRRRPGGSSLKSWMPGCPRTCLIPTMGVPEHIKNIWM